LSSLQSLYQISNLSRYKNLKINSIKFLFCNKILNLGSLGYAVWELFFERLIYINRHKKVFIVCDMLLMENFFL